MTASAAALPAFPDSDPLLTVADAEAMAERLGLIIVTDGSRFEYARPGLVPPGWRQFRMVQRLNALDAKAPRA